MSARRGPPGDDRPRHAQVVIVGGGPVGLGLAIELGRRGVSCLLLERRRRIQHIPKGQNLTQRTVEHFAVWGVAGAIARARLIPREYGINGLTAYGSLLGDYHYDWLQRDKVRPYYFADNDRLPQYLTERVLRARLAELPTVRLLSGWEAQTLERRDGRVGVHAVAADGAARCFVTGEYLVGCDGSRSRVREQAGIGQQRDDHDRRMVLLVFRSRELNRLLQRFPGKSYFNVLHPELDGYWRFFGRVDPDEQFFFHAPVPAEAERGRFDFTALLHAAVGAPFALEFDYVGFWDLRIATAERYRSGRVLIAGDAAHSHPPYGGFGINTGFEDARNLGWKLAAVLAGWGGPRLLDSYDGERRPVFVSTARDFIRRMIDQDRAFVRAHDPAVDRPAFEAAWRERAAGGNADVFGFEPHYEGSPLVYGPPDGVCSARGEHRFAARAGHHLAPLPLSSARPLLERLGDGFALLALDADPAEVAAVGAAAAELGLPLRLIRDDRGGGRDAWQARLVLVRPDHYVAFAGERLPASASAMAVLRRSAGLEPAPVR